MATKTDGLELMRARRKSGVKQDTLAKYLMVSRHGLMDVENEHITVDRAFAQRYLDALAELAK